MIMLSGVGVLRTYAFSGASSAFGIGRGDHEERRARSSHLYWTPEPCSLYLANTNLQNPAQSLRSLAVSCTTHSVTLQQPITHLVPHHAQSHVVFNLYRTPSDHLTGFANMRTLELREARYAVCPMSHSPAASMLLGPRSRLSH